ncbi:MAG: 7-cyano-7-deazaguanine synthase [Pseudorhodoplanes sp.]|nr:7-cyano-7-deazaguanine synthase [Pseudorhodoplanes sp.]
MTAAVLLCSGGLDSTTLAYWMREREIEIVPIFFDYGQHCVETEWRTLRQVLPTAGVREPERIDVSGIFRGSRSRLIIEPDLWNEHVADEDLYIPYRTLLFFSIGAAVAQTRNLSDVYSGFINSNHAKELDCSAAFLNELDALATNVGPVRFHIPFRAWSKAQVVAEAVRLDVEIGATYSCQLLSDTPCGACPNCVERLNAIEAARGAA